MNHVATSALLLAVYYATFFCFFFQALYSALEISPFSCRCFMNLLAFLGPLYRSGPARKVPGRHGMSYTEEDWVDDEATSRRGSDE
jgi:hypothetical protein